MGLRSASGWQTQDTRSQFGGATELTPKQQDMAGATSPLAFNQPNEPTPKEPKEEGTTAGQRAQFEAETKQQEQAKQTPQARQQEQASPISQAVEAAASKLSTLSYTLRGYVNQFLQGGTATVGLGQAKEQYKYDPDSGKYVLSVSDQQQDVEPVLQEKMRQQERLKQGLSPFAQQIGEKLVGKQFGQVLEEQFGQDPQIANMLQMVESLQMLEAQGMGTSPEAKALEAQMREMDQFGMVSSLREAMQSYNKLMGVSPTGEETKWYGDQGDTGYSALDLAQLSSDTLRTEIEKAREFSSGLFGGDFEENLKKKFDTESAEGQAAARRKEAMHAELMSGFQDYMDEASEGFQTARDTIDTAFKGAAEAIKAELALDDTPSGIAAMKWFESFQEGGDFTSILYNAMNDPNSGLGVEQRQAIADFIGKAGSGSKEGQLYTWIHSLGTTGKLPINIRGEDGLEKTQFVEPTTEDKLKINALMENKTMSPEEKTEKMHELIRGIGVDAATNIGTTIDNVMEMVNRTGSLAAGVVALNRGIVESLKTFAQSKTEDFVRQSLRIDDKTWNAMDPAARSSLISRTLTNMTPEQKEQLVGIFHRKQNEEIDRKDTYINQWKSSLNGRLAEIDGDPEKGIPGVLANVQQQIDDLGAQKNKIYSTLAGNIQSLLQPDYALYNKINQQLGSNGWVLNNLNGEQQNMLSQTLAWHQKLTQLAQVDPQLAAKITGGAYSSVDPVDLAVSGARNKDFSALKSLNHAYSQAFGDFGGGDYGGRERILKAATEHVDSLYSQYKSNPNSVPPGMLTLMNVLGEYENTDGVLRQNLKQVQDARDKIVNPETGYLAQIEQLSKSADFPSFTPDQILGFSMQVARGVETGVDWITGDKQPPSLKDIDWGKLGGEIEDIITNWAGYGPDALKDELSKKLGFPADSISIKGGVPHIQMSDGSYVPFSDALITKLSSATTENFTPEVAALPGEYAGMEMAPSDLLPGALAKLPNEKRKENIVTFAGKEEPGAITKAIYGVGDTLADVFGWGKEGKKLPTPSKKELQAINKVYPGYPFDSTGMGVAMAFYSKNGRYPTEAELRTIKGRSNGSPVEVDAVPTQRSRTASPIETDAQVGQVKTIKPPAMPNNVKKDVGKVFGSLGAAQGMLVANAFYSQTGRWPTVAELKSLKKKK